MNCCHDCEDSRSVFGPERAEADLRRYQRKGPDPSTRLILEELRRLPLEGTIVLDVGGGIGVLGLELMAAGTQRVVEVEASNASLKVSQQQFAERGWGDRLHAVLGDFAKLGERTEIADLVTLDRVVCCYPNYEALLGRACGHARRALALSFPRNRWYVRASIMLENLWRRLTGNSFRAFVHSPTRLAAVVEGSGLRRVAQRGTLFWEVEVYHRLNGMEALSRRSS